MNISINNPKFDLYVSIQESIAAEIKDKKGNVISKGNKKQRLVIANPHVDSCN